MNFQRIMALTCGITMTIANIGTAQIIDLLENSQTYTEQSMTTFQNELCEQCQLFEDFSHKISIAANLLPHVIAQFTFYPEPEDYSFNQTSPIPSQRPFELSIGFSNLTDLPENILSLCQQIKNYFDCMPPLPATCNSVFLDSARLEFSKIHRAITLSLTRPLPIRSRSFMRNEKSALAYLDRILFGEEILQQRVEYLHKALVELRELTIIFDHNLGLFADSQIFLSEEKEFFEAVPIKRIITRADGKPTPDTTALFIISDAYSNLLHSFKKLYPLLITIHDQNQKSAILEIHEQLEQLRDLTEKSIYNAHKAITSKRKKLIDQIHHAFLKITLQNAKGIVLLRSICSKFLVIVEMLLLHDEGVLI